MPQEQAQADYANLEQEPRPTAQGNGENAKRGKRIDAETAQEVGVVMARITLKRGEPLPRDEWMDIAERAAKTPITAHGRRAIEAQARAALIRAGTRTQMASAKTLIAIERMSRSRGVSARERDREQAVLCATVAWAIDIRHGLRLLGLGTASGGALSAVQNVAKEPFITIDEHATHNRADTGATKTTDTPVERCIVYEDGNAEEALDALARVHSSGRLVAITGVRPAPDAWRTHRTGAARHTVVGNARIGTHTRITVIDRRVAPRGHKPISITCDKPNELLIKWAKNLPGASLMHRHEDEAGTDGRWNDQPRTEPKRRKCVCGVSHEAWFVAPPPVVAWRPAPDAIGRDHPCMLTESSGLAAVESPPGETLHGRLEAIARRGALSNAQSTAAALARASFETDVVINGRNVRSGFLLGDGTGTGKSRIAAALIAASSKRPSALWITPSGRLFPAIEQELRAVGMERHPVAVNLRTLRKNTPIAQGSTVCVATWSGLAGDSKEPPGDTARLRQVLAWLGADFKGVIVLDEAHVAGVDPRSRIAAAAARLHAELPRACFLYASATIAEQPASLGAAERLGLWGAIDSPWRTRAELAAELGQGNDALAAACARWLKATGAMVARDLSLDGVEIEHLEVKLEAGDRVLFDSYADAAAGVRVGPGGRAAWEGARHRAFLALTAAFKARAVAQAARADSAAGRSAVIQLVHTEEAALRTALENDATSVPGPRETLIAGARAARASPETIRSLEALAPVAGALDRLVWLIGADGIAELTARRVRTVRKPDGTLVVEHRTEQDAMRELAEFEQGKRTTLVFSEAGGTGAQYATAAPHPVRRRVHYVLEPALGAVAAVQGLGRTHRAHQAIAPIYRPSVMPELLAERRAAQGLGARLETLGAATRAKRSPDGAREKLIAGTASTDQIAVQRLLSDIRAGKLNGWTETTLRARTGLGTDENVPIERWLNRIMALSVDEQRSLESALDARTPGETGPVRKLRRIEACAHGNDGSMTLLMVSTHGDLTGLLAGASDTLAAERRHAQSGADRVLMQANQTQLLAGMEIATRDAVRACPDLAMHVEAQALWRAVREGAARLRLGNGWTITKGEQGPEIIAPAARKGNGDATARKRPVGVRNAAALAKLIAQHSLRDVAAQG